MRKLRLLTTTLFAGGLLLAKSFAQPVPVESYLIDPMYPVIDQPMSIYVNASYYGLPTEGDTVSAWTGLITSASNNMGDWKHNPISNWPDESILLSKVNDTVFKLDIADLSAFYGVNTTDEPVFRIAFIPRGHQNGGQSGQTSFTIYFEIFDLDVADTAVQATPALPNENEKAVITFNINKAGNALADSIAANPADSVFIYTAANSNLGNWRHEVSSWPTVGSNSDLKLMRVSDSIYRMYYIPSPRDFYDVTSPIEVLTQLNFVVRNGSGSAKTDDQFVPLDVQPFPVDMSEAENGILMIPAYPTVDDHIVILIDANAYVADNDSTLNPASTFNAWSGLVTSASANAREWQHQVNGGSWTTITGDSIQFTRLNDSVQYWEVPSIADKYNVNTDEEEVFRLILIARDTTTNGEINGVIGHQTDDLFFEVYGSEPTELSGVQPSAPDAFAPMVVTANINATGGIASYSDTLYAHTGVFTNLGEWQHVLADWNVNNETNRLAQVNDSVYRFYIFPSVRDYYTVGDGEKVDTIVMIFRKETATLPADQSVTFFIPVTDTTTVVIPPDAVNDIEAGSMVSIYPNPTNDKVTFDLGMAQTATINIFTTSGQLIYSTSVQNQKAITLNTNDFSGKSNLLIYQIITQSDMVQGQLILLK